MIIVYTEYVFIFSTSLQIAKNVWYSVLQNEWLYMYIIKLVNLRSILECLKSEFITSVEQYANRNYNALKAA